MTLSILSCGAGGAAAWLLSGVRGVSESGSEVQLFGAMAGSEICLLVMGLYWVDGVSERRTVVPAVTAILSVQTLTYATGVVLDGVSDILSTRTVRVGRGCFFTIFLRGIVRVLVVFDHRGVWIVPVWVSGW